LTSVTDIIIAQSQSIVFNGRESIDESYRRTRRIKRNDEVRDQSSQNSFIHGYCNRKKNSQIQTAQMNASMISREILDDGERQNH